MYQHPIGTIIYTVEPNDNINILARRFDTTENAIAAANPNLDVKFLNAGEPIYICPGLKITPSEESAPLGLSKKALILHATLRKIWSQYAHWTNHTINSMVFYLPDLGAVGKRLLKLPQDLQQAIIPYYGKENAAPLPELFRNHILLSAQFIKAAIEGDCNTAKISENLINTSCKDIASFFSCLNQNWKREEWELMLYRHAEMFKLQLLLILSRNYAANITEYDKFERQSLKMADLMASGIIKQFPHIHK